jgi:ferredoxin-NADP reductase
MSHVVKITSIERATHDVLRITTEKPSGYVFVSGQATDVCVNKPQWENEKRAFTFTSLPNDTHLEFTIKTYQARQGVTNQLLQLKKGDELILHEGFGDISYKGEGLFIAGGAGITPFIAILRSLNSQHKIGSNKLIFANKTKADIINEVELRKYLGANFINVLSDEKISGYEHGFVSERLIKTNSLGLEKYFYLCGPPPMMDAVEHQLMNLNIQPQNIIKEGF